MVNEKKLVEEVPFWLKLYDDGSTDRAWTGPPAFKFMSDPVPPHDQFIDGVATEDVTVDEKSGLRARIYLPEMNSTSENKIPILIHFHGGGFCIHQPDYYMYYHFYTRIAKSIPAIVVSPYLRLAPENRLPAAMDDGYATLLWIRSLAKGETQIPWLNGHRNFSRIFLIGDSSGGNVVHHVASRAGKDDITPLKITGAILVHPGFVRSEILNRTEMKPPGSSTFLTVEIIDKLLCRLALPVGSPKDHPLICPLGAAAALLEELSLPPYLICVAENDLLKETQMEFYEAMRKANKEVELILSAGVGHSFYVYKRAADMDPNTAAQTDGLIQGIKGFINKH